jgi:hypothetical protein
LSIFFAGWGDIISVMMYRLVAVHQNFVTNSLGRYSGVRVVVAGGGGAAAGIATISLLYPALKEHGQLFMKDLYVGEQWRAKVSESKSPSFLLIMLNQKTVSALTGRLDRPIKMLSRSISALAQNLLQRKCIFAWLAMRWPLLQLAVIHSPLRAIETRAKNLHADGNL